MFHDSFWVTKRSHPAGGEDLRQAGRVAEHVGDPHLGAAHAEVLLEVALAVHDLAHEALARRQVHVGLDPHAADRDPLPVGDLVRDAVEQLGLALLRSTRTAGPASTRSGSPGRRPSGRPPRRTCACTCAPSRGSATATPCRCGRARWRRRGGRRSRPASPAPAASIARGRRRRPRRRGERASSARGERAQHARPARIVERQRRASRRRARRGRAAAPRRRGRRRRARRARTGTAARRRRWPASRAATGGTAGTIGFDAASTTSSTGPGSPVDGDGLAARVDALHRPALGVADERPRTGSPASRRGSRGRCIASTRRPAHAAGTSPREAEPRRAPRRAPRAARRRTAPARRATARPRPSAAARSGCTSGSTRSVSSRVIRSSTSSRSSCIADHRDIPRRRRELAVGSQRLPGRGADARRHGHDTPPPSTTTTTTTTAACSSTSSTLVGRRRLLGLFAGGVGAAALTACGLASATRGGSRHQATTGTTTTDDRGRRDGSAHRDARGDRRAVPRRRLERRQRPHRERHRAQRHPHAASAARRRPPPGVPLTIDAHGRRRATGCAPLAGARRVPLALRPRRQLLAVHAAPRTRTTCAACRRPTPTAR